MGDNPRKRSRRTRKRFEIPLNVRQSEGTNCVNDFRSPPIVACTDGSDAICIDSTNANSIPRGTEIQDGERSAGVSPVIYETFDDEHEEFNRTSLNTSREHVTTAQQNPNQIVQFTASIDSRWGINPGVIDTEEVAEDSQLGLVCENIEECEDRLSGTDNDSCELRNVVEQNGTTPFPSPFAHWSTILAVLLVTGSIRYTRSQFDCIRIIIMCMNETKNLIVRRDKTGKLRILDESGHIPRNMLPSSSTVYRVLKPYIQAFLGTRCSAFVYSRTLHTFRKVLEKETKNQEETKIMVILVSEHARMDVSFPPFLNAAKETDGASNQLSQSEEYNQLSITKTSTPGLKHWECIDDWPLIGNREEWYWGNICIHAKRNREQRTPWKALNRAYAGDLISVTLRGNLTLSDDLLTSINQPDNADRNTIVGEISAIRIAAIDSSVQCSNDPSDREQNLQETILRKLIKKLHECDSHILLSGKRTINRRQQLFGAGDTLALIDCEHGNFIVVVNRFNVPNGEYDENVFRISYSHLHDDNIQVKIEEPIDSYGNIIADVESVEVLTCNPETSFPSSAKQSTNSFGRLQDGRRYFVYRFILFWDGFIVGSKSMEGIYCLSLNLPSRYRSASNAVRVLSLLPKEVPSSVVFKELLNDIKVGMTSGFEEYDADGKKVTVFLDMVACIGDTPALNEVIEVRGHNAIACCHICRFRRLANEKGITVGKDIQLTKPRYIGTEVHGGKVFASRSTIRHSALREYQLDEETLKRIGMKNSNDFTFSDFPEAFKRISSEVPLTSNSFPVVPSIFDNYRSLLIGPDHLIFGLAKDCINAVLALLPKDSYLSEFEDIALYFLRQARLRTQGKLISMEKRTLFTMTISEVFALLQISEYSFHVAVMKVEGLPLSSNEIMVSKLCKDTIELLGSLATVAARIWFTPRIDEDGKSIVREYNAAFGTIYLSKTQDLIEEHITKMREVSSYNDEDAREYQSIKGRGRNVQRRKKQLEKSLRESQVVMAILDKPNVHRLLELAHVSLPMMGSATRITELEFERGHQAMKRAVESSNPSVKRNM